MAENETNEVKAAAKAAAKKEAPAKAKVKKPNIFSRFAAWLKSCKAEMKKVTWAKWPAVKSNTIMVLVCIVLISAVIGLVDFLFSQGFTILGKLI